MTVKRVIVVDPDTGDRAVRTTVECASADAAAVEALRQMIDRNSLGAPLRKARALLAEIADTPEHNQAKEVLDRGQAVNPNHPEAGLAWMEFCALYEHAKRRIVARKQRADRSAGGDAKAAKIGKKHKRIVAAYQKRIALGEQPRTLPGILARNYHLTPTQIRTILKEAKVR